MDIIKLQHIANANELMVYIKNVALEHNWSYKETQENENKISTITNHLGDGINFTIKRTNLEWCYVSTKDNVQFQMAYYSHSGTEGINGYLLIDEENFILNMVLYEITSIASLYLSKSHDFKGGRFAWTNFYHIGSYIGDKDFRYESNLLDDSNMCLELSGNFAKRDHLNYAMEISSNFYLNLGAKELLNVGTSQYNGALTLITPHIFYLNNVNKWVHAGYLDKIRIFKGGANFQSGQILYQGNNKFMVLRVGNYSEVGYIWAVKIV